MKIYEYANCSTCKKALKLFSENEKLVKRPFVLTATSGRVGFKEESGRN